MRCQTEARGNSRLKMATGQAAGPAQSSGQTLEPQGGHTRRAGRKEEGALLASRGGDRGGWMGGAEKEEKVEEEEE